jgi:mRNA interferase HigB
MHPQAETSLDVWYRNTLEADWASIMELRTVYPHADAFGRCTVFNIHGNRYRLIARINYEHRTVYIRNILTHKEYDEGRWKDGCESD